MAGVYRSFFFASVGSFTTPQPRSHLQHSSCTHSPSTTVFTDHDFVAAIYTPEYTIRIQRSQYNSATSAWS